MITLNCIHHLPKEAISFLDILPYLVSIGLAIWSLKLQKTIESVKAANEKKLHVDKTQFNKEFEIYSEIWGQLVDMRIVIETLRPFLDNADEGKTYEETVAARYKPAIEKGNLFIATIEKNRPFYAKHVYSNLSDIISLIKNEIFEISNKGMGDSNYWTERKAGLAKFSDLSEKICESIRQRIGQINQN